MENNFIEIDIKQELLPNLFGDFDCNIKIIEEKYNVSIIERNNKIKIIGDENSILKAQQVILYLINMLSHGEFISINDILYATYMNNENKIDDISNLNSNFICRTFLGKPIKPKTFNQKKYVDSIENNIITFGIGPAGTGKTFLAICMAFNYYKLGKINKIILTRPAIEAGEKLGFLPGDLQNKVNPYLRPLFDGLFLLFGADNFNLNMEKGIIEIAPLAYMRGRTLENAFIILDEAQNTTIPQMKMFLTRIGFNSKVVITGDITQTDLSFDIKSGLIHAKKILNNIDNISFIELNSKDVVRHPIVQKIIDAYEKK